MSFDYYASLAENKACPKQVNESGLVSSFGDGCVVWSCQDKPQEKKASDPKNEARQCYMKRAAELNLQLPTDLGLDPNFTSLLSPDWLGIEINFTLQTPWYSKDDRPFHVLDNPVRKDRVFGAPFMSASSWKGLLRWACRMQHGLLQHFNSHDMKMDGWEDPSWIIHLFGNEKGESENFKSGALAFYPTWFNKIGFEVINPHSRVKRAGTQPIYYEVVPAGTKGHLRLLYAPTPGAAKRDGVEPVDVLCKLVDAINMLLPTYGISAKRTAGWGTARMEVEKSKMWFVESGWFGALAGKATVTYEPPEDVFKKLMDHNGKPISCLCDADGHLLAKSKFRQSDGEKPCSKNEFGRFCVWYKKHGDGYKNGLTSKKDEAQPFNTKEIPYRSFMDALKERGDICKGHNQ